MDSLVFLEQAGEIIKDFIEVTKKWYSYMDDWYAHRRWSEISCPKAGPKPGPVCELFSSNLGPAMTAWQWQKCSQ